MEHVFTDFSGIYKDTEDNVVTITQSGRDSIKLVEKNTNFEIKADGELYRTSFIEVTENGKVIKETCLSSVTIGISELCWTFVICLESDMGIKKIIETCSSTFNEFGDLVHTIKVENKETKTRIFKRLK